MDGKLLGTFEIAPKGSGRGLVMKVDFPRSVGFNLNYKKYQAPEAFGDHNPDLDYADIPPEASNDYED